MQTHTYQQKKDSFLFCQQKWCTQYVMVYIFASLLHLAVESHEEKNTMYCCKLSKFTKWQLFSFKMTTAALDELNFNRQVKQISTNVDCYMTNFGSTMESCCRLFNHKCLCQPTSLWGLKAFWWQSVGLNRNILWKCRCTLQYNCYLKKENFVCSYIWEKKFPNKKNLKAKMCVRKNSASTKII